MENKGLDPWKGGGFGMFSGLSAANLRVMTVTLVTRDGRELRFPPSQIVSRIPLNGDMAWFRTRLLTMPRPRKLQELADRLAGSVWVSVPSSEPTGGTASSAGDDEESLAQDRRPSSTPDEVVYYRMEQDVRDDVPRQTAELREVRVEIWEYRLNADGNSLKLTRLAVASSNPR